MGAGPIHCTAMNTNPAPTRPVWARVVTFPIEDWLGCVMCAAILAVMSLQIFLRYVLNISLIWSDELSRFLLIAMAFIGCATGVRKRNHIRIDVIDYVLGERAKRLLWLAIDAIVLFYLVYIAVQSIEILRIFNRRPSTAMGLPMSIPYGAITVGFGLAAFRMVLNHALPRRLQ
jgi:TRAP-type C4-dicarboxylate transport system permease small subunit